MTNRVFFDLTARIRKEMADLRAFQDREVEDMKAENKRMKNIVKCRRRRARRRLGRRKG